MCKHILIFAVFLLRLLPVSGQIINTIAGTGTLGFSGDTGPASLAQLNLPFGIAIDTSGNIYISDSNNDRIRKVNSLSGIITTIAGTGVRGYSGDGLPAVDAQLARPHHIALDRHGNIFFADRDNNRIRKINTSGIISTVAGTIGLPGFSGDGGHATDARLYNPYGIAVDTIGNIFIGDYGNVRIRKIDIATGIIQTIAGIGVRGYSGDGIPATLAKINGPEGITLDMHGNLYFADQGNSRIRKVDNAGIITTLAGNGSSGYSGDGSPATSATLNGPTGVFTNGTGEFYIADFINNRIRKIDVDGEISTITGTGIAGYGGDGGLATNAMLNLPTSIAVSQSGIFYIADFANSCIRVLTHDAAPFFVKGHRQTLNVCSEFVSIDTLLAVVDSDIAQTAVWSIATGPAHGTAVVAYSIATTGGLLTPVGLSYSTASGYFGPDTFKVQVTDGFKNDTTEICINVLQYPRPGAITGPDSVCIGATIALTDTPLGGSWAVSGVHATIAGGVVTGISEGTVLISYSLSNLCGVGTSTKTIRVIGDCHTGMPTVNALNLATICITPNPNDGRFTIQLMSAKEQDIGITITNIIGEKVLETRAYAKEKIAVKLEQPAGIYFITVSTEYGVVKAKMVLR